MAPAREIAASRLVAAPQDELFDFLANLENHWRLASTGGGLAESRTWLEGQGLARPRQDRMIAGVCAGLARRYGMPVFLVRSLAVAAGPAGFGVLVYVALWVLMPTEG